MSANAYHILPPIPLPTTRTTTDVEGTAYWWRMAESKKKGYFRSLPNTGIIAMEKIQINSFVVNQKQEKHVDPKR